MSVHPTLNYTVTANDVLHTCPYDPSHRVLGPRLSLHLMKCRRAYIKACEDKGKRIDIVVCKWNSNHQMREQFLQEHELGCPDRESMADLITYHADPNWKQPGPAPASPAFYSNASGGNTSAKPTVDEEDWDAELKKEEETRVAEGKSRNHMGYNPMQKLQTGNFVYNPQGMTKSERKAHFAALQVRRDAAHRAAMANEFRNEQAATAAGSSSGTKVAKPEDESKSEETKNILMDDNKEEATATATPKGETGFVDLDSNEEKKEEFGSDWWDYEMP